MTERTFADEIAASGSPVARGFELSAQHRSLTGHSIFLRLALIIYVLTHAAVVALSCYAYWFLDQFLNNRFESEEQFLRSSELIDVGAQALNTGALAMQLFCILAYCLFVYRAAANIQRSNARGMSNGPGWAVGWSFIPFANFVKIYEILGDIWQSSRDPHRGIHNKPWLFPAWWGCYLGGNLLRYFAARLIPSEGAADFDTVHVVLGIEIVSSTLSVVSGLALIAIVAQIARAQANWNTVQRPVPAPPIAVAATAPGF